MAAEPLPLPEGPRLSLAPEYPPGVPVPDPPIIIIGRDVHNSWEKVWQFVQGKADPLIANMQAQTLHSLAQVVPAIQAYAAEGLKALGGYINDVGDFAHVAQWMLNNQLSQVAMWAKESLDVLDVGLYDALQHINMIEGDLIPQINTHLGAIENALWALPQAITQSVEQWAADNIFTPLVDELGQVNANIRHDVWALVGTVASGLQGQITANHIEALGEIGALAVAVGALEKFTQECSQPMCEYAGPNTDIGKFLKALQLAGILALLMEIGNMTEADVEARLRELAADVQHIVGAFDGVFVGGGGSLRDFALSLV